MKNKRKKGFTLIELLAVILVLAIIMLIAYPSVRRIINAANANAFKVTAEGIVDSAETLWNIKNEAEQFYYVDGSEFNGGNKTLPYRGENPKAGVVDITEKGDIAIAIYDGTYCAAKAADEDEVTINISDISDCSTYNIIDTEDTWQDIADNNDTTLDDLLDLNDETDENSTTKNRDIKVPVNPILKQDQIVLNDPIDTIDKTYYSLGKLTYSTNYTSATYEYTIELGKLPLPISKITNITVTSSSVFEELLDFKKYIVKKLMGEVIWPAGEQFNFTVNDAPIFHDHAVTSSNMTVDNVSSSCDETKCYATITETVNNLNGVTPNLDETTQVVYLPVKFTVEFNGEEEGALCSVSNPTPDSCFTFDSGTGTITAYDDVNCTSDVIVPCTIAETPVTTIGEYAFDNSPIDSIVIPSSVTSLAEGAFYWSNVSNIMLGDSITTIGDYAISGTNITSINIPNSVTTLGEGAFYYNQLTSVNMPSSITSMGDYAFECNALTSLTFQPGYSTLGYYSFGDNYLTTVDVPGTVTNIGDYSFAHNELTSATLNSGIITIGEAAFDDNHITSVSIPNTVTTIGPQAFHSNAITNLSLSNSLTSIGYGAFSDNQLPDAQAFIYGRNLDGSVDNTNLVSYGGVNNTVAIPSSVTTIDDYAFCKHINNTNGGITSVALPSNLISIGEFAFAGNNLTTLSMPNTVTNLGRGAFYKNEIVTGNISTAVTAIDYVYYDNNLTSIVIPASVTSITNSSFSYNNFTSITIQGANPQRFNATWTQIGFPIGLRP